jgi:hypothetical protein
MSGRVLPRWVGAKMADKVEVEILGGGWER